MLSYHTENFKEVDIYLFTCLFIVPSLRMYLPPSVLPLNLNIKKLAGKL